MLDQCYTHLENQSIDSLWLKHERFREIILNMRVIWKEKKLLLEDSLEKIRPHLNDIK